MDPQGPLPKMNAFLLSWIAYAGGALLGALGARELPHRGFLVPMALAMASLVAVSLTPERFDPERGDDGTASARRLL